MLWSSGDRSGRAATATPRLRDNEIVPTIAENCGWFGRWGLANGKGLCGGELQLRERPRLSVSVSDYLCLPNFSSSRRPDAKATILSMSFLCCL